MMREPFLEPDSDVVYLTRGESEDDFEIVHVVLPTGFGSSLASDERQLLPLPGVSRVVVDREVAERLIAIWAGMLSGNKTVAPPPYTDIEAKTRFTFAVRIGEAAKTSNFEDGSCAGDLSGLGLALIGLADAPEQEKSRRLSDVRKRARALRARL
jgi:hypothetical protein